MRPFKQFCEEVMQVDEKLITFGNEAYAKFGQIVILAGGAGSDKGFVLDELLGIEGNVLDVDAIKALALGLTKFASKVEKEYSIILKDLNLENPEHVNMVNELLADTYGISKKNQRRVLGGALVAPAERKPNIIFDVTMKDVSKLESITRNAQNLGYDKKNIHVFWVLNDLEVAQEQNKDRDRVVPDNILLATHEGVSITMARVMDMGSKLNKYLDGDMFIAFNKTGAHTAIATSKTDGPYIEDADYFQIKEMGKQVMSRSSLPKEINNRIKSYVSDTPTW